MHLDMNDLGGLYLWHHLGEMLGSLSKIIAMSFCDLAIARFLKQ